MKIKTMMILIIIITTIITIIIIDHDKLWPLGSQGELPAPPGSTNTGDTLAEARGPFGNYRRL